MKIHNLSATPASPAMEETIDRQMSSDSEEDEQRCTVLRPAPPLEMLTNGKRAPYVVFQGQFFQ
jgi:hypothetical protein